MADRYFPNTFSDYVAQNSNEDSHVQAEDVILKAAIALRDEVRFYLLQMVHLLRFGHRWFASGSVLQV